MSLLRAEGLSTWFQTDRGVLHAVSDVDLELSRGRTLGLVGESGSGKSVLVRSIMGIQPAANYARFDGHVWFDGRDLRAMTAAERRRTWLRHISIVPQNTLGSLNPVLRIGTQLGEILRYRFGIGRHPAADQATALLEQVGIPEPERRLRSYPHELSGGMRQRVAIAMALAGEPDLLIADEPTTALDVTVQAQIVALLRKLRDERDMAMIFVSHDIAVVASLADEIAVMYGGRIVEQAPTPALVSAPRMPYTEALLRATPRLDQPKRTLLAVIPGRPPSMVEPQAGCAFHPRCEWAQADCAVEAPALTNGSDHHSFACWHPVEQDAVERDSVAHGR
ncbi:MAG: ABC transporter ATP-binding protein [Acidimicrobiia bacterium]